MINIYLICFFFARNVPSTNKPLWNRLSFCWSNTNVYNDENFASFFYILQMIPSSRIYSCLHGAMPSAMPLSSLSSTATSKLANTHYAPLHYEANTTQNLLETTNNRSCISTIRPRRLHRNDPTGTAIKHNIRDRTEQMMDVIVVVVVTRVSLRRAELEEKSTTNPSKRVTQWAEYLPFVTICA